MNAPSTSAYAPKKITSAASVIPGYVKAITPNAMASSPLSRNTHQNRAIVDATSSITTSSTTNSAMSFSLVADNWLETLLEHGKALANADWKRLVDHRQLALAQSEIARARIFLDVLRVRRFRDREERGAPHQKRERDLGRGCVVLGGNRAQHATG